MTTFTLFLSAVTLISQSCELTEAGGETVMSAKVTCVTDKTIPPEGYRLSVKVNGITIASSSATGTFYARQTQTELTDRNRSIDYIMVDKAYDVVLTAVIGENSADAPSDHRPLVGPLKRR